MKQAVSKDETPGKSSSEPKEKQKRVSVGVNFGVRKLITFLRFLLYELLISSLTKLYFPSFSGQRASRKSLGLDFATKSSNRRSSTGSGQKKSRGSLSRRKSIGFRKSTQDAQNPRRQE